jgi:glycyl-tRNA synthetase beta chain
MPQLLLELFSEEIPARMQAQAGRDLERLARDQLTAAGLGFDSLVAHAGPRRLTLAVEGLPAAQEDRAEELKGPRVGAPPQALDGFLRKTGLSQSDLVERDGVYFATLAKAGRSTTAIVAEMVEAIVRGFPWPKSMRSGASSLRWVRPLKRILCLFDRAVVPIDIDGIKSGDLTEGHRFMGPSRAPFAVTDFADYQAKLVEHFVVLDPEERKARIVRGAEALVAAEGLELVDDPGLLDEVSGLAEWPTPILGKMDPAFLDLPGEVIRTSMRTHQKYFAVRDPKTGKLAPRFLVVANIEASDGGLEVARGNAKVLSARLSDARFFWDEDRKVPLESRLEKLKGVTFHIKLGTMYERVERIAALAREIAPMVGADPDLAEKAARLAKADLGTGMVGEFPELQGIMGGYYARLEGAGDVVADAVRDHYKPQGPSDSVPTAPVTVAAALADKLDTLVGFFAIDERPTGSKDPYALRRAALGVIRLLLGAQTRLALVELITSWFARELSRELNHLDFKGTIEFLAGVVEPRPGVELQGFLKSAPFQVVFLDGLLQRFEVQLSNLPADAEELGEDFDEILDELGRRAREFEFRRTDPNWVAPFIEKVSLLLRAFFADRLKVLLRDQGQRHDLVDAVFALGDDDLVRVVAKVEALTSFLSSEDGANLLAGYKRASNILKAEAKKNPGESYDGDPDDSAFRQDEEIALHAALQNALAALEPLLGKEDFVGAMTALAALRRPVDDMLDKVFVNDPDPAVRLNRLRLLSGIGTAVGRVADFSLISG